MSLNSYLDEIASKLIIKGTEKESIQNSISVFKSRMQDYFLYHEVVGLKEVKVFGSYHRDTNLPQRVDYGTDVDIMLVMDDDGVTPQTYLDRVRRAVEAKYATSSIKQSSPTIVLQMQHIKFEITPAILDGGLYKIKNSSNEWMYTFCATDLSNLTSANKNNHYMIKPAIRLVKYWNKSKNYGTFASYEIEKAIVNYYSMCQYDGYNTKQYLLSALKSIRKLAVYEYQKERLQKAIDNVQEAIEDEDKYPSIALDELKRVIGEL